MDVYQTAAGAGNQPTGSGPFTNVFTETGLLPANTSVKYIAYVSVDDRWKDNPLSVVASSNSEIIRFTMHDGWMSNVKTIMGPQHHADTSGNTPGRHDSSNSRWYYYPIQTAYHHPSIFGKPDYWDYTNSGFTVGTAMSYARYDIGLGATPDDQHRGSDIQLKDNPSRYVKDINGQLIQDLPVDYREAPIAYPYNKGDGQVDLRWWLRVDDIELYNNGVQTIDGTFRNNDTENVVNPVQDAVPVSGGTAVYSGAPSVFLACGHQIIRSDDWL